MIVVTKVDIVEVDEDPTTFYHYDPPKIQATTIGEYPEEVLVEQELIHGKRFVNRQKQKVVIGLSKQVQEALGIPLEVISILESRIEYIEKTNKILRNSIAEERKVTTHYVTMPFFQRLKFLFTKRRWKKKRNIK